MVADGTVAGHTAAHNVERPPAHGSVAGQQMQMVSDAASKTVENAVESQFSATVSEGGICEQRRKRRIVNLF